MKEIYKSKEEQWIPWETSYSLKEVSRNNHYSKSNGIVAVILPDEYGSYDYFSTDKSYIDGSTKETKFHLIKLSG